MMHMMINDHTFFSHEENERYLNLKHNGLTL